MEKELENLFQSVQEAKNILLVAHAKPDGDTLGSTLAFAHYCNDIGKKYTILCHDKPAEYFSHLPMIGEITQWIPNFTLFDLIVCLDHGALEQSKFATQIKSAVDTGKSKLINIDHHISNSKFGAINIVMTDRSSTCEALYSIFLEKGVYISKNMSTCLLTGLITDTGHFMNSATKYSSLEVASDLIRRGAKMPEIAAQVINNKNIASLNLWGTVFDRLTVNEETKIAYSVILQDDLNRPGVDKEAIDGLVNFLTGLKEVKAVMLLIQEDAKTIKGSFRTQRDDVNVSDLASIWGGGGHKKAAGFKLEGKLVERDGVWAVV